jgi:UDPglucose 6-dehydrogenase
MEILVVGAGYVGLVSAVCFAELGHQVTVVDNDKQKLKSLSAGKVPIHEAMLPELLARHHGGRLQFSADIASSFRSADVAFITVGTPPAQNGEADLSSVEAVVRDLALALDGYKVVVEKSTVPARTSEAVERTMMLYGSGRGTFSVASNPEFLREGTAVSDFLFPDRIVIGADCERSRAVLKEVYRPLTDGSYYEQEGSVSGPRLRPARLISTSVKSAELIKHASNAFLAMKISFINAVANICEGVEADIREVCEGIGSDSRIGQRFLSPGIGYGGSCFPKDVLAFRSVARDVGYDFKLLTAVMDINAEQKMRFLRKVREALWNIRGKQLAVLGLAFKGGTDDVRDSPAMEIVSDLLCGGASIVAFDPAAMTRAETALPRLRNLHFASNAYEACVGSDAVLVLTEWDEFRNLDLFRVRELLKLPILLDGKNIYNPADVRAAGLQYHGIGSPTVQWRQAKETNSSNDALQLHLDSCNAIDFSTRQTAHRSEDGIAIGPSQ